MKTHRIIVAGSRYFTDYKAVSEVIDNYTKDMPLDQIEIVSGCCHTGEHTYTRKDGTNIFGADGLGERYAEENEFPVVYMPADWKANGKAAGPLRNEKMSKYATHCLVFWDGLGKGSLDMIKRAAKRNLEGLAYKFEFIGYPLKSASAKGIGK